MPYTIQDSDNAPVDADHDKKSFPFFYFYFFPVEPGFARDVQPVTVLELLKTGSSWNGQPLPSYSKGKPEITIVRITIQPGGEFPLHKHPMINAGILLSGELTVTTEDNKILHLKAGDAIAEVVNTWH